MQIWASFAEGQNGIFSNAILKNIGAKYGKTPAQVILRWLIERKIPAIPKTTHKERMRENFNVFDFKLDTDDMCQIAGLDERKSFFFNPQDSKHTQWIIEGKKIINGEAV